METRSYFVTFILIYMMNTTVTSSQLAGSTSYFFKWKEHKEYTLPETSLEFTYKATSELECSTVCCDRTGFEACAGFAFIFINNQWTCTLAIKDSNGTRPNLLETTYSDHLYIDNVQSVPEVIVTQTETTIQADEVTTTQPTTERDEVTTTQPTTEPDKVTTTQPTTEPDKVTTTQPTTEPDKVTTTQPTTKPDKVTTTQPTTEPDKVTTTQPTTKPDVVTTTQPTTKPDKVTTTQPTTEPDEITTTQPTTEPDKVTTTQPTTEPDKVTTTQPTTEPDKVTTTQPTTEPDEITTTQPTTEPDKVTTTQPTTEPDKVTTTQPTTEPDKVTTTQPTTEPDKVTTTQLTTEPDKVTTTQPTTEPDKVTTIINMPTTEAEMTTLAAVYTIPDIGLDDTDCDEGWKYNYKSNTFYCYDAIYEMAHDDTENMCPGIYDGSYLVAVETAEEHQFLIDNAPVTPSGGSGLCYHTSGKLDSGSYNWESTSVPVIVDVDAYCTPPAAECITIEHGCDMKLSSSACSRGCYAICEKHP